MSDLISRSEVINILEKEKSLSCGYDSDITIFSIEKGIRELPTAYDVEKVVEELEKRKQEYLVGFGIHDNNEMYGVACGLGDAIEIVKHGSVDNDVCEWELTDTRKVMPYKTSCGNEDLYDNSYKYCPYCGKKIRMVE